jgi:hypothetical protein
MILIVSATWPLTLLPFQPLAKSGGTACLATCPTCLRKSTQVEGQVGQVGQHRECLPVSPPKGGARPYRLNASFRIGNHLWRWMVERKGRERE